MAPTPKLSTISLIDQAIALVDREGYDSLSVSAVANEMKVAPSALYTYCEGLNGLRNLVAIASTDNLTKRVRDAATGTSGEAAVTAIGIAYRRFSHEYPGQFASTIRPPAAGKAELDAANRSLLDVFVLVYMAMGLDEAQARLAARSTRSAIHGFVALEHSTGTAPGHTEEYQHLLQVIIIGLRRP